MIQSPVFVRVQILQPPGFHCCCCFLFFLVFFSRKLYPYPSHKVFFFFISYPIWKCQFGFLLSFKNSTWNKNFRHSIIVKEGYTLQLGCAMEQFAFGYQTVTRSLSLENHNYFQGKLLYLLLFLLDMTCLFMQTCIIYMFRLVARCSLSFTQFFKIICTTLF